LPIGQRDEQDGGCYRLASGCDAALFGYTSGVQSWRRHLFPPRRRIWSAELGGQTRLYRGELRECRRHVLLCVHGDRTEG
jgi:hypothetical protein